MRTFPAGKAVHTHVMPLRYLGAVRTIAAVLAGLCVGLAGCAAAVTPSALPSANTSQSSLTPTVSPPPSAPASAGTTPLDDPLHGLVLRDVRTDAEFTLGQLAAEGPVLLETMAIWCTKCRAQQREVVDAHGRADFDSVSLDVDPNERSEDLANYADREGFDWRFAVADGDLVRMLRDRFGTAVLNPPSMPKILFRTDGSIELIGLGEQLSASDLAAMIAG